MKPHAQLIYATLLATATAFARSDADTNEVFLPVDPRVYTSKTAEAAATKTQTEAAKSLSESRPAKLDPEGHWGEVISGLQMSIRFDKTIAKPGEAVTVTVILRNTTTNPITVFSPTQASIGLVVANERKEVLPTPKASWTVSGPMNLLLPGHRQFLYRFKLGEHINLTSEGVYSVYAKRRTPERAGGGPSSLRSASATIRILGS
jgi:hypothetical protein